MEFLHLNATYGRLEQQELHLRPGLNVICAPNESGKSTWSSFIRTMLYGLPSRDRGPLADKNRYAPWSGAAMQGRMDVLADGRACTLLRSTRRAVAPMGEFSCTYTGTAAPVEGITALNAGEQLLGVPRDVFERSAFIGQNALAVEQSAELERRIAALITTGEEDAALTLLEGQAAALAGDMTALAGQRAAAEETRRTAEEARAAWEAHPLYPDDPPALERRAAAISPGKAPSFLLTIADALLLAICAVLTVLFRDASPQRWIFLGMAVLAAGLTAFSVYLRRRAIRESHALAQRQRDDLAQQTAAYLPLRDSAAQTAEAAQQAAARLSGSEESCRARLTALLAQAHRFAPGIADLSGVQSALTEARRRRSALTAAAQQAREAALYRNALRAQLSEEELAQPAVPAAAVLSGNAASELAQTQEALAAARSRYDTLLGRIRALDSGSDLADQLAQKQEELTRLQQEYDAIALAMTALEQANTILETRFSPALGARAAEIFSALTGGKYDKVLLSRDLTLSAEAAGDPMSRSIQLLSQGAADQLYLAVRLAICDMVLPAEKHVPLILDDALVSFDDTRLRAALDYLLAESAQRQILLFTCQGRERDYLADRENVNVLAL